MDQTLNTPQPVRGGHLAAKGSFQVSNSSITELSLFLSRERPRLLHLRASGTEMQQLYTQSIQ